MTREEQDEKEFEEWWKTTLIRADYKLVSQIIWLASRRLMREKENKDGY